MTRFIFFILFITTLSSRAQEFDELRSTLDSKNIQNVFQLFKQENKKDGFVGPKFNVTYQRELITNYSELLIKCDSIVKKSEREFQCYFYYIRIIKFKDTIIYCNASSFKNFSVINYKYSDTILMNIFQSEYFKVYRKLIEIKDLFSEKVIYGNLCGLNGNKLEFRKALDKIIKRKKIKELENWLTSPIAEIQIYAVDGFYQLEKLGYVISPRNLELINQVLSKSGEIQYCSGCFVWYKDIKDIKDKLKLNQGSH